MTNDLVERLEHFGRDFRNTVLCQTCREAAARIEELEAALEPIKARLADRETFDKALYGDMPSSDEKEIYVRMGDLRAAVRPLKTKEKE